MTKTTANPFFNVERHPVFVDHNGQRIDTNKSAIINNESGDVYGLVTPKYKIVTNQEVANVFDEALDGYDIDEVNDYMNADGSKWYRDIIFGNAFDKQVQVGDTIKTKIRIKNSYDGKSSVGFEFGGLRLVCTNGMTTFRKEGKVSIRHFSHNIVDSIRDSVENGLINYLNEVDIFKKFIDVPFSEQKFIEFVLNEVKDDKKENKGILSEKQAKRIIDLTPTIKRQYGDTDENKWSHFNVLTAYQTHFTKAHKGSNQFSAGYRRMQNLIERFVHSDQ